MEIKTSSDKRFALLIDADNVSARYIKPILNELSKYGTVTIKRIYGDWTLTLHAKWKDALLENSITPIQQFGYTQGKNATDSAMIIDAMDILYTDKVDGFCIVSSDSDFTRLAARLRESGRTVIGMGEKKTPTPFRRACDVFTTLELLVEKRGKNGANGAPARSLEEIEQAVVDIITDNQNNDKPTGLGEVGSRLLKRYPDFDVRSYGTNLLSKLLSEFTRVRITKDHSSVTVELAEGSEKQEKAEKPEKPGKTDHAEKQEKAAKAEKPERPEKPARAEKTEKAGRAEGHDGSEKTASEPPAQTSNDAHISAEEEPEAKESHEGGEAADDKPAEDSAPARPAGRSRSRRSHRMSAGGASSVETHARTADAQHSDEGVESASTSKPEPQPTSEPVPEPAPASAPEPAPEPEAKPKAKTRSRRKPKGAPQTEPQAETTSELAPAPEPQNTTPASQPEPSSEPTPKPKARSRRKPKAAPQPQPEPAAQTPQALIRQLVRESGATGIALSSIGKAVRASFKDFKVRDLGFSQLRHYVGSVDDFTIEKVGRELIVKLAE